MPLTTNATKAWYGAKGAAHVNTVSPQEVSWILNSVILTSVMADDPHGLTLSVGWRSYKWDVGRVF